MPDPSTSAERLRPSPRDVQGSDGRDTGDTKVDDRDCLTSLPPPTVWITHAAAAELLGIHVQTVSKLLRRGVLQSRGHHGPHGSIDQAHVLTVRGTRAVQAHERDQRRRNPPPPPGPRQASWKTPPDADHEWLNETAAGSLMGVTRVAISQRAKRGRLPHVIKDGRRWYRRDLLALVRNADLAQRRRSVTRSI